MPHYPGQAHDLPGYRFHHQHRALSRAGTHVQLRHEPAHQLQCARAQQRARDPVQSLLGRTSIGLSGLLRAAHASGGNPYCGTSPTDLCSTYNWCNRFSGRHNGGGNILFSDAHVAWFKYSYVIAQVNGKIADPEVPDINWEFDSQ